MSKRLGEHDTDEWEPTAERIAEIHAEYEAWDRNRPRVPFVRANGSVELWPEDNRTEEADRVLVTPPPFSVS